MKIFLEKTKSLGLFFPNTPKVCLVFLPVLCSKIHRWHEWHRTCRVRLRSRHGRDHRRRPCHSRGILRGKNGLQCYVYHWSEEQSSQNHVCHVRRKIQMSDVGFVKIIIIWCLCLPIGRHRVKSFREDWRSDAFTAALLWKLVQMMWWRLLKLTIKSLRPSDAYRHQ